MTWRATPVLLLLGAGSLASGQEPTPAPPSMDAEGAASVASPLAPATPPSPGSPPPPAPTLGFGRQGFWLSTADGDFELRLRGVIQSDGRSYVDAPPPAPADAFLIRRARLYIEGVVGRFADFRLLPDFAGGQVQVFDAWVNLGFAPWIQLRSGKMKSPFGLERLQAEQDLLFQERGLPSSLAPDRDIGIALHGELASGVLAWELALLNGVPDGASADLDARSSKDVAARIFVRPFRFTGPTPVAKLGVGVAATAGRETGTAAAPALPRYLTAGQQPFFAYRGGADAAVAAGERRRLSPQGFWYLGPVGLLAEWVVTSQQVARGGSTGRVVARAWQVEASVVLTGEPASYEGVEPSRLFRPAAGRYGAVELAARYGELRVDRAAFPVYADPDASARRARAFGAQVNWHLSRTLRMDLSVERTRFAGGAPGGDRPAENALMERLQLAF